MGREKNSEISYRVLAVLACRKKMFAFLALGLYWFAHLLDRVYQLLITVGCCPRRHMVKERTIHRRSPILGQAPMQMSQRNSIKDSFQVELRFQ